MDAIGWTNGSIAELTIGRSVLKLTSGIDEFKGAWQAIGRFAPERLAALRQVATIESAASSTRIEGAKLSDREVERLLANLDVQSFATRDEQEVASAFQHEDLAKALSL